MSGRAVAWAARMITGSVSTKAVLFVLAEAADEAGWSCLGQAEIALRADLTPRTVVDQLAWLEAASLIVRMRRGRAGGRRAADAIQLKMRPLPQGEAAAHWPAPQGEAGAPWPLPQSEAAAPWPGPRVKGAHPGQGGKGESDDRSMGAGFTSTSSAPAPAAGQPRRQIPLPDGFPTPLLIARAHVQAAKAGVTLDLAREAERFRNHALKNHRHCFDWSVAWRGWVAHAVWHSSLPALPAARPRPE